MYCGHRPLPFRNSAGCLWSHFFSQERSDCVDACCKWQIPYCRKQPIKLGVINLDWQDVFTALFIQRASLRASDFVICPNAILIFFRHKNHAIARPFPEDFIVCEIEIFPPKKFGVKLIIKHRKPCISFQLRELPCVISFRTREGNCYVKILGCRSNCGGALCCFRRCSRLLRSRRSRRLVFNVKAKPVLRFLFNLTESHSITW
jgi:hypothetical protein